MDNKRKDEQNVEMLGKIEQALKNEIGDGRMLDDVGVSDKVKEMMRLSEIEKAYNGKVKCRTMNYKTKKGVREFVQYYLYIDGKQISAKTEEELYDKILQHLKKKNMHTIESLFEEWIYWQRDENCRAAKTLYEYKLDWNRFYKDSPLAQNCIEELSTHDIKQFFRRITNENKLTAKRYNNIKSILNGIYDYAIGERGLVSVNLSKNVSSAGLNFRHPDQLNRKFYKKQERTLIVDKYSDSDDMYELAIAFDFNVVMRKGELLALRWDDIDGNNIKIQRQLVKDMELKDDLCFEGHNYKIVNWVKKNSPAGYRMMPLNKKARRILEKVRKLNPDGEYIFMKDNDILSYRYFERKLKKLCSDLGVPELSSHKIRFCVASTLYEGGLTPTDIQKLLGHQKLEMTLNYLRSVVPLEEVAKGMDEYL